MLRNPRGRHRQAGGTAVGITQAAYPCPTGLGRFGICFFATDDAARAGVTRILGVGRRLASPLTRQAINRIAQQLDRPNDQAMTLPPGRFSGDGRDEHRGPRPRRGRYHTRCLTRRRCAGQYVPVSVHGPADKGDAFILVPAAGGEVVATIGRHIGGAAASRCRTSTTNRPRPRTGPPLAGYAATRREANRAATTDGQRRATRLLR